MRKVLFVRHDGPPEEVWHLEGAMADVVETISAPLRPDRRGRGMTRRRDYTRHLHAVLVARWVRYTMRGQAVPPWTPGPGLRTVYPHTRGAALSPSRPQEGPTP
jgi:hypothetical protein